ncbi:hypothetical protein LTR86_003333 [Recurvomyces mirabilis]|nr:hypothetical protein LTR86_003333 [Recurvomyces mirabilis]
MLRITLRRMVSPPQRLQHISASIPSSSPSCMSAACHGILSTHNCTKSRPSHVCFSTSTKLHATHTSAPHISPAGTTEEYINVPLAIVKLDVSLRSLATETERQDLRKAVFTSFLDGEMSIAARGKQTNIEQYQYYILPEDPTPDHLDILTLTSDKIFYSTFDVEGVRKPGIGPGGTLQVTFVTAVQLRWRFIETLVWQFMQVKGVLGIEMAVASVPTISESLSEEYSLLM